MTGWEYWQYR